MQWKLMTKLKSPAKFVPLPKLLQVEEYINILIWHSI